MSMEAQEPPVLEAATKQRPMKTEQTKNITSCCTFHLVSISFYSLTCNNMFYKIYKDIFTPKFFNFKVNNF
jgi:hypothetical protein